MHNYCSYYIQLIQNRLKVLGYTDYNGNQLVVDGDFGENTEIAVKNFKHKNGLQVSNSFFGQVDETTWNMLFSYLAIRNDRGFGTSEAVPYGNFGWAWPMDILRVTSYWGWRNVSSGSNPHIGFDVADPNNPHNPVYSVANGNLIEKAWYTAGGWGLALETNDLDPSTNKKLIVRYLHLEGYSDQIQNASISRTNPFPVNKGQTMATSGNTGGDYAYHLHFDVNKAGKTGKDFNIIFSDTVNPHYFFPNLPLYNKLHPEPAPETASLNAEPLYNNPEYVFDYELIRYVGKDAFFNWLDQLPLEDQTVSNFREFFKIADEVYYQLVGR